MKWTAIEFNGRELSIYRDGQFMATAVKQNAQTIVTGMNELEGLRLALAAIYQMNIGQDVATACVNMQMIAHNALTKSQQQTLT